MGLLSKGDNLHAVVAGCSGGIGYELTQQLLQQQHISHVTGLCRQSVEITDSRFSQIHFDINEPSSIEHAAKQVKPFNLLIIATGLLHDNDLQPEKSLSSIQADHLAHLFNINTIGPAVILKELHKKLIPNTPGIIAVISAKVGSISDNYLGGWYGYRSSKAAVNMIMRCTSIEVQRFQPLHTVVSLHPGTVHTALSNPFTKNYPTEAIFPPEKAASQLISVIERIKPQDNGLMLNWNGEVIPF